MKLGVVLDTSVPATIASLQARAAAAEEVGFDLLWIEPGGLLEDPIVLAGVLAPGTASIRLVAAVQAGGHPVALAEDAAVADLSCQGRFALAVGGDEVELLAETVDLLFRAGASAPFRHSGHRWTVPANLPENELHEARLRVTPDPFQLELPIWVFGPAAGSVAATRGVSLVAAAGEPDAAVAQAWRAVEQSLGPGAARLRRPAIYPVPARPDVEGLVRQLSTKRDSFGLDIAVLRLPDGIGEDEWRRALRTIATEVRPRLQLDRLPEGLDAHWRQELHDDL